MRPIIGVTGYLHPYSRDVDGVFAGEGYTNGLAKAGAAPVVIPYLEEEEEIRALAHRLDGLLLSGGPDMDPILFGEEPHPANGNVSPERDTLESILFDEMQRQGKPVFGICRGAQIINILLGGTIYQDLPSQYQGELVQHDQRAPRWFGAHHVTVTPGTILSRIFDGADRIRVNTYHHQAIREVAPGLVVSGVADDGVIEAVERPAGTGPYLVAVQWHPENMWRKDGQMLHLFQDFVAAVEAHCKQTQP
ncbi:gamma-glutamyl-gamma-aminobutyrate hydrolase family protein [Tumebacillus sp. DT12]|uniref:Gamma-glutamyl-gamma-aminobutyrate hydrolase family protein n=1 Tax=Tumebacillus lacus TaxID=2995335 RepID=A0ABT3X5T6_9BACL|nr:gamma-glutamyl-gamma-aminobutyrate hydrolase family protein [Tumebacillus lacus]MCX7572259.1 gamma-glutamyl-gamma-aminobutyrate hydrolase family protein [Tumebacillus lacus]